ncbi:hypothetical protein GA707_19345 [Nostocoides sp. F2B08]|nr:hypothetical protein GA707_19345 [Tetrasphaera sp. F2B08]
MSSQSERPIQLIWATRGRTWGFRFLLDGGWRDPLAEYERAFSEASDRRIAWHRTGGTVAVRFPDPQGRRDASGRVIPHEFVAIGDLATHVNSVAEGIQQIWPLVEHAYARVWNSDRAPTADDLRFDAPTPE